MNKYLITLLLLAAFSISNDRLLGQNIFKRTVDNEYYIEHKKYSFMEVEIYNNSNENLLLWLENDSIIQNQSIKDKVKNYFLRQKGDASLLNIINEYGSTIGNISIELFYTFYKIIPPKKSFYILFNLNGINDKEKVEEWVNKIVTMVTQSELRTQQINYLNIDNLLKMSYKGISIVLPINE